ncbi:PAS domain-containing sensor histidine kinase [Pseudalkalibacillus berkeleyi]|uniref:histidine kinase n=1 Tax=Pseudalkalibacillus berkeleyi TaxID=1069813 RepID=A0ABS9H563_9BACL|nr:PAS domain-containing sensor histidine kinase [Pseudalkalibacillus berkeleyi]MCF6138950.1 PAS domain S-box protein [Pseudalkalibacillus berkeleyi]
MHKTSAAPIEMNPSLIDQLSDGFIRVRADGVITHANPTINEWYGGTITNQPIQPFFSHINVAQMNEGEWVITESITVENRLIEVKILATKTKSGGTDLLVKKVQNESKDKCFDSLFYENDVPIFIIDLHGNIVDINRSGQEALQYNREQLLGKFLKTYVGTKDLQMERCIDEINKGNIATQQVQLKSSSGDELEFEFTHIPMYVNEQLTGAYCIARNNSALRKTEEALLESEHRYQQLVDHSPDPVCLHDSERIIYVNDVAAILLGVEDKSQLIGEKISKYIHVDHQKESNQRIQKVMQGKRNEQMFPMKVVRPDGDVLETEGKAIPIKEDGKTYVLAVFRDVTEKNQAKRSLQKSERRYRSLFLHNPDGIYSINLKGELTSINPAIVRITGFTAKEQIGRHYVDFLLPEDQDQIVANYESIFEGKTVKFEKRMKRKDGEVITVRVVGFPMIVDKEIVGMYGILRDITDEKRSEELLRRSEKLSVVGELAAAIAHEIRNPLTSIKGFVQMMENGLDEKALYYNIVLSELDRIEQIISELLVLAKPQSVSFQRKEIGSMIRHVLKLLEGQANLHNIQFVEEIENEHEQIDCEENQLKQVFINLIKNAIEVMPDGGTIKLSCKKDGDHLLIQITDQGPGIPEDRLSRLGEPFYTTKEKGTGLGLMVSFKIIKDHQGSIHFSSEVNKGTTVDILFPLSIQ